MNALNSFVKPLCNCSDVLFNCETQPSAEAVVSRPRIMTLKRRLRSVCVATLPPDSAESDVHQAEPH